MHRFEPTLADSTFTKDNTWPTLLDPPTAGAQPKEVVTFVKFENGCFQPRLEQRMLRCDEHPRVWKAVQDRIDKSESLPKEKRHLPHGLLIKGHPGIGKTLTLDFLLSWSLSAQPNRPVIVVSSVYFYVFFATPEGTRERYRAFTSSTSFDAFLSLFIGRLRVPKCSTILILHDLRGNGVLPYQFGVVSQLHDSHVRRCVFA